MAPCYWKELHAAGKSSVLLERAPWPPLPALLLLPLLPLLNRASRAATRQNGLRINTCNTGYTSAMIFSFSCINEKPQQQQQQQQIHLLSALLHFCISAGLHSVV